MVDEARATDSGLHNRLERLGGGKGLKDRGDPCSPLAGRPKATGAGEGQQSCPMGARRPMVTGGVPIGQVAHKGALLVSDMSLERIVESAIPLTSRAPWRGMKLTQFFSQI